MASNMDFPMTDPPKILILAPEIIALIAKKYLEPHDLFSLRSTCHTLQRNTYYVFCQNFKTLSSDLSLRSLQRLEEIAKPDMLKDHVECLIIKGPFVSTFGQGFSWNRHASGNLIPPFPALPILQDLLLNKFSNCRSFRIRSGGEDEVGSTNRLTSLTPSDMITLLFHLLANTGIQLKSFGFGSALDPYTGVASLNPQKLHLPLNGENISQKHGFLDSWSKLEDLTLRHAVEPETIAWATNLLVHTPNLKKLTLRLNFTSSEELMSNFTSMAPAYSNLQELSLSSMRTSSESLLKLLSCCKNSLRILDLFFVVIPGGRGTWDSTFTEMASNLPVLESFSAAHLQGGKETELSGYLIYPKLEEDNIIPKSNGQKLELVYKKKNGKKRTVGVKYQGQFVGQVLRRLAETTEYLGDAL